MLGWVGSGAEGFRFSIRLQLSKPSFSSCLWLQRLHGFGVEVLGNSSKLLAAIAGTYGGFYERKTSLQGRANFAKTSQDGTARGHYNSR